MTRDIMLALLAERYGEKLLAVFEAERAGLEQIDQGLKATAFGMGAIGAAMSLLVTNGVEPADAARRVAETADGVAEDLS